MFFKKNKTSSILAPISGEFVSLDKVNDTTFSSGLMGNGFAINPSENIINSPIKGTVTMIFPTGHAFGIRQDDGLELLLHIGIETVNLNGAGFNVLTHVGDKVSTNDHLLEFDRQLIKKNHYEDTVIVLVTNSENFDISFERDLQKVKVGKRICNVKAK